MHSTAFFFRSKHSTETALIKIIDDLLFNLDNDRVSGMVLLKKLEVYGISRVPFDGLPLI